ncbi:hypothetical protein P2Q00_42545 [Streptomyces coacervatus]|uniref:hypothetical protein n=1 Tax=Streptomyces coacervatus TaxID=647381 RepID=UPI0023DC757A|nr:hypothetical protein [Streptomyces coacervatus]MDF2272044.1 hypothetical protein [Streptomyces coacervatus]
MDPRHQTSNVVDASWSLADLRDLIYNMLSLLSVELGESGARRATTRRDGRSLPCTRRP